MHFSWLAVNSILGCPNGCKYCLLQATGDNNCFPKQLIIPREAVAEFSESSDKFPGINIVTEPVREYTSGTLASHILGYASTISAEEYATRKDTYEQNDIIGLMIVGGALLRKVLFATLCLLLFSIL